MFDTGSIIKNLNIENIEDGIKQVNKLYLQRGFKITHIHDASEFIYFLFLLDRPTWPYSMLIFGWRSYKPRTEAIGKLESVPIFC